MIEADLLIHSAAQVVTCASDVPKRGEAMQDVGLIADGAVGIRDGRILTIGSSDEVRERVTAVQTIDATGKVIIPGFVDPHTHVVYAGDRVDEFEQRIRGTSYMEIMAAGGGIVSTMRATRQASVEELVAATLPRLHAMLQLGTTTAEVKTGYGLDLASELRMLEAIAALDLAQPIDLIPTFMPAHAVPPEFNGRSDAYVDWVVDEMIPAAAEWYKESHFVRNGRSLFCDVFCEQNAFDLAQSRRVLEAGLAHGMPAKIHADEFTSLGGVGLAVDLEAVSVDHLDVTVPSDRELLANSDIVGVILPAVNFNLGSHDFANARALIDAGAALALSTDINPGSAPCPSMPLVLAIASRYQRLLPAECLNAATINAAYAVGLGSEVGSLEVGKRADLLLLDTADYRQVAYQLGGNLVEMVVKNGRIIR
ncbi:Imidazolonepropionase [hydrothermal vent metagenome]|uniref:imidazolonepropionase n=1 Tax=hydrothermal vent metagenome TaxID=652676 RepID=A0A3B0VVY7_9ZZZZ